MNAFKILFQKVITGGHFSFFVEPECIHWPFCIFKLVESLHHDLALAGRLNFMYCYVGFPMEILEAHKWKGMNTSSSTPPLFCAFHVEKLPGKESWETMWLQTWYQDTYRPPSICGPPSVQILTAYSRLSKILAEGYRRSQYSICWHQRYHSPGTQISL